jgi:hypothetical protein
MKQDNVVKKLKRVGDWPRSAKTKAANWFGSNGRIIGRNSQERLLTFRRGTRRRDKINNPNEQARLAGRGSREGGRGAEGRAKGTARETKR